MVNISQQLYLISYREIVTPRFTRFTLSLSPTVEIEIQSDLYHENRRKKILVLQKFVVISFSPFTHFNNNAIIAQIFLSTLYLTRSQFVMLARALINQNRIMIYESGKGGDSRGNKSRAPSTQGDQQQRLTSGHLTSALGTRLTNLL